MCRRSPVINRFGTFFERRVLVSISASGTPPSAMTARSKPISPSIVRGRALSRCTSTLRSSLVTECTFLVISIVSWSNMSTPLCVPSGTTSLIIFLSALFVFLSNTEIIVFSSDPRSVCGYASIVAVTAPLCRRSATAEAQLSISGPERPKWVNKILPVFEKDFFPSTKKVIFINDSEVPDRTLDHLSATLRGTMVGVGAATVWPGSRSHSNPSPVEPVSGCDKLPVARIYDLARYSILPQYTALMPAESETILVTAEPVRTTAPQPRTYSSKTFITSPAFSLRGNARLRACTTSGSPRDSKNVNVSLTPNCAKSEYKNCSALPYMAANARTSTSALVILQRPPPEMPSFSPSFLFFSNKSTREPRSAARPAAMSPDAPPPITITSYCAIIIFPNLKPRQCGFFPQNSARGRQVSSRPRTHRAPRL